MDQIEVNRNIRKEYYTTLEERFAKNCHPPKVIWLYGLSGGGKSTIAKALEKKLFEFDKQVFVLDGDNLRFGLNQDLGFSDADRKENIRRLAHVSNLFYSAGFICIVAAISPFQEDRNYARSVIGKDFIEIYVSTPLEVCKHRDPKGLYEKASSGIIENFTGISSPFEKPVEDVIEIDTTFETVEDIVTKILKQIEV